MQSVYSTVPAKWVVGKWYRVEDVHFKYMCSEKEITKTYPYLDGTMVRDLKYAGSKGIRRQPTKKEES